MYPLPQYTATVTSVGNEFTFSASALPFNLNDQLLPGVTAKVIFQTGMLAGYEIEIASYDNTNKTFVINKVESEKSLEIPSVDLHAEVGDTFIIVDMNMPAQFVTLSEQQLASFGLDYYKANNFHKRNYAVTPDRMYFKKLAIKLEVADQVRLVDGPLAVDRLIPIEAFKTFYAKSEWDYELTLSDYPVIDPYTRLIREQIKQANANNPKPPIQSPKVYTYTKTQNFVRNNCQEPYSGSDVSYTKKYISNISQADALSKANADNANFLVEGQANANAFGSCNVLKPIRYIQLISTVKNGAGADLSFICNNGSVASDITINFRAEGDVSGNAQSGSTVMQMDKNFADGSTTQGDPFNNIDNVGGFIESLEPTEDNVYRYQIG